MRFQAVAALVAASAFAAHASAGYASLTHGRSVSLVSGTPSGVALSTLTDGSYLNEGTQWQTGTVWWSGTSTTFEIGLGGACQVWQLDLQGDNNDTYAVSYRNMTTGLFESLWTAPIVAGAGMRVRQVSLSSAVTTDAIRITATSGDNLYSLSEVQASGIQVPAPGAFAVLGMAGLAGGRRRRR